MDRHHEDPTIMDHIAQELLFIRSRRKAQEIDLEIGDNAVVRFLPARLGAHGIWYARIATHWLHSQCITCPRLTGDDFVGSAESACPVCLIMNDLGDDKAEDARDLGRKIEAIPLYLTYCLLLEKNGIQVPMQAAIIPCEFWLQERAWEELSGFYMAATRKSPNGVMDYVKGNDFRVRLTEAGTLLDKLQPRAIFDLDDPGYEASLEMIEAAMKNPKVFIPTLAQLEAFAGMVQREARKLLTRQGETEKKA